MNGCHVQVHMLDALHRSIDRDELHLVYQPKYDLITRSVVGIEALLRWKSRELGVISPAVFIPMAEQSGFIGEIDYWVLNAAVSQYCKWSWRVNALPRLAINVSAIEAGSKHLVSNVCETLSAYGLPSEMLEIEITETAAFIDLEATISNVDQLRDMGVAVALDDFGAGHSSLKMLQRTAIDTLKLDRCLISGIDKNREQQIIVSSVIQIARDLEVDIVAEGIETQAEEAVLRRLHCTKGQGYLFTKPLTAEIVEARYFMPAARIAIRA